jgi:hypothetical protein
MKNIFSLAIFAIFYVFGNPVFSQSVNDIVKKVGFGTKNLGVLTAPVSPEIKKLEGIVKISSPTKSSLYQKEVPEKFCNGQEQKLEDEIKFQNMDPEKRKSLAPNFVATYQILNGNLFYATGDNNSRYKDLIMQNLKVFPKRVADKIGSIAIDKNNSYGAQVVPSFLNSGIRLDLPNKAFTSTEKFYQLQTLIHEIGHIMAEFDGDQKDKRCTNGFNGGGGWGCMKGENPMFKFYSDFWKNTKPIAQSVKEIEKWTSEELLRSKKDFVSIYAGKNAPEDFAETFMHWVLDQDISDEQPGAQIKMHFFETLDKEPYNFVALKKEIRALLAGSHFCKK